jgi:glycosyltransferase involved in cell wall biosynthesis
VFEKSPAAGVNLVGYLNNVIGIGESARQFAGALEAAGVPHALAAIEPRGAESPRVAEAHVPWLGDADLPFETTVLWCNPDRYGNDVDPGDLDAGPLIGRWAWELPELPGAWSAAAAPLDEVWTPSRFVADAVADSIDLPVRRLPPAVAAGPAPPLDRERWGIPQDGPLFAFMFDHNSTLARKNPLGLIEAYRRAFSASDGATLFIKTVNAHRAPRDAAALRRAAAGRSDVIVLDAVLTAPDRNSILAGCDAYVSLHRSEGFGMTLAEAMAFGRPVIATAFGGNLDFTTEATAFLVDATPAPVGPGVPIYPAEMVWADPDLGHAARLMRRVVDEPAEAAARGALGRELIRTQHAPGAVGALVARELPPAGGSPASASPRSRGA